MLEMQFSYDSLVSPGMSVCDLSIESEGWDSKGITEDCRHGNQESTSVNLSVKLRSGLPVSSENTVSMFYIDIQIHLVALTQYLFYFMICTNKTQPIDSGNTWITCMQGADSLL